MFSKFRCSIAIWLLLVPGLAACSGIVKTEQAALTGYSWLQPGAGVGQTFVARYDGLQSITVHLEPITAGEGELLVNLYAQPGDETRLSSGHLALSEVDQTGYYTILIEPVRHSTGVYYYLELSIQGRGAMRVGVAGGDSYLNGTFYREGAPTDVQMAFRLGYASGQAALGLCREGLTWVGLLLAGLLLYIVPGWALLSWLLPGWDELHWSAKLGISSGVSLALYPLLFLWTDLAGLHLGALYAWLPGIVGLMAIGWRKRQFFMVGRQLFPQWLATRCPQRESKSRVGSEKTRLPELALIGILGLIVATRFWAIRGLEAPLWGDSQQHTMITQLLIDNQGLFDSWQPYADLESFTYHYGFHSLTAVLHWVTHLPARLAMLWAGQLLNCLAVLSLLPLVLRWQSGQWGGVAAVLLTGLLFAMPMYYTNWGRYTQLAGQVILPGALYLMLEYIVTDKPGRSLLVLNWLALAGLALTHYRVLVFAACFFPAIFLLKSKEIPTRVILIRGVQVGSGALAMFLPWFLHTYRSQLAANFAGRLTTPPDQASEFLWQYNSLGDLSPFLPIIIWLLLVMATGWGLWRNKRPIAAIAAWCGLVVLAANPQWLGLPGMGVITNFAVLIAAYIPAGLILGITLGDGAEKLVSAVPTRFVRPAWLAGWLALALLVTGAFGARQRLWDIDPPSHALVTRPDLRAAEWVQANLPQEALFLVNSFFAYSGSVVVGSDAGWWLPLLGQRKTTLPPIAYENEAGPAQDDEAWNEIFIAETRQIGFDHPDVIAMLRQRGVTHVYIGQRQGQVNTPEASLQLEQLLASPRFTPVYHQDRVWIFALQKP